MGATQIGRGEMSIDMAQFHQVFFEESFEGLEIMETGLLGMEPGAVDDEEINAIFRGAHSIKGGAGTFGFMEISDIFAKRYFSNTTTIVSTSF